MNSFCVLSHRPPESSSESECETDDDSTCSSSSDSEVFDVIAEIKRKKAHPDRLHDELWYNDPGQVRGFYAFAMRVASPHITFTTQGWEGACWLALKWNLTPRAVSRFSEPFPFCCRVQLQGVSLEQLFLSHTDSACDLVESSKAMLFRQRRRAQKGRRRKEPGGRGCLLLSSEQYNISCFSW